MSNSTIPTNNNNLDMADGSESIGDLADLLTSKMGSMEIDATPNPEGALTSQMEKLAIDATPKTEQQSSTLSTTPGSLPTPPVSPQPEQRGIQLRTLADRLMKNTADENAPEFDRVFNQSLRNASSRRVREQTTRSRKKPSSLGLLKLIPSTPVGHKIPMMPFARVKGLFTELETLNRGRASMLQLLEKIYDFVCGRMAPQSRIGQWEFAAVILGLHKVAARIDRLAGLN